MVSPQHHSASDSSQNQQAEQVKAIAKMRKSEIRAHMDPPRYRHGLTDSSSTDFGDELRVGHEEHSQDRCQKTEGGKCRHFNGNVGEKYGRCVRGFTDGGVLVRQSALRAAVAARNARGGGAFGAVAARCARGNGERERRTESGSNVVATDPRARLRCPRRPRRRRRHCPGSTTRTGPSARLRGQDWSLSRRGPPRERQLGSW